MRRKLGENEKPSLLAYIVNNLRFRCKVKKTKLKTAGKLILQQQGSSYLNG